MFGNHLKRFRSQFLIATYIGRYQNNVESLEEHIQNKFLKNRNGYRTKSNWPHSRWWRKSRHEQLTRSFRVKYENN